ncbi:hypothetical protein C8R43DRAFT_1104111 [Mycena crocata]|nr:hypothetical protein C8R43DRAFT_1104111 [Mycena crocata]
MKSGFVLAWLWLDVCVTTWGWSDLLLTTTAKELERSQDSRVVPNGYVPTQSETKGIQTDLDSLSKELARLDSLIRDLSVQRDKIKEVIGFNCALISPVRRLPDDVLREVFLACLPSHRNAVMSTREAPLLLCRVCSTWRVLALATPPIWASLHLHLGFVLQSEARALAAAQWLARSAACALSLSIAGAHPPSDGFLELLPMSGIPNPGQHILGALVQSTARWRDVTVNHISDTYLKEFRAASTPLLQVVRVRDAANVTDWLEIFAASSVHTLELDVGILEENTPVLLSGLSHITNLSIACNSGPGIPGIPGHVTFSIMTKLTQLVFLKIAINELPSAQNEIICLPLLESLDLGDSWVTLQQLVDLLDQLAMPQLLHLAIGSGQLPQSTTTSFAKVGERSPLVQSLRITLHNFTPEMLRETLPNFPSLAKLVVHDTAGWNPEIILPDTTYILTLLTERAQTNPLPSLRVFESRYGMGVSDQTLFAFLQSRVDVGGSFRLRVEFPFGEDLPDVQQYSSSGLDIAFTHGRKPWMQSPLDPWSGLPMNANSESTDS